MQWTTSAGGTISAVVVTRGDYELAEVLASLAVFKEVVVWDNSVEDDLGVYGRYAAIERASSPVIFVQDDDCVLEPDAILALVNAYEPGRLVANMPRSRWNDYPDSALLGWGAIFDRDLPATTFARFHGATAEEADYSLLDWPEFLRECDTVVATLAPHLWKIDVGFRHLPWAEGPGRMFTDDPVRHREERARMLELVRKVRDA